MTGRDIIVIGTSAGGVEVLTRVVRGLPPGLPASLFVVCHFPPAGRSVLPEILSRAGPLLATHPADGDSFYPGQIYIAPPDHHLLLEAGGRMRVTHGPRENNHRPAVDPLFRSAARAYGSRVIGVVLTGGLYDGVAGLMAVRSSGGVGVVQDPYDAAVAAMPLNAAQLAGADHVVTAAEMSGLLTELVHRLVPRAGVSAVPDPMDSMPDVVNHTFAAQAHNGRNGDVSVFTCPECGGSLWQVDDTGLIRFRCHVGHSYEARGLLAEQERTLEAALWTAVRTFRQKTVLAYQLAHTERVRGDEAAARRYDENAEQSRAYGDLIVRRILVGPAADTSAPDSPPVPESET
jgi:two-component system chemotaxis response regulator CheB